MRPRALFIVEFCLLVLKVMELFLLIGIQMFLLIFLILPQAQILLIEKDFESHASAVTKGFLKATNSHLNGFQKAAAKSIRENCLSQQLSETCSCGF